VSLDVAVVAIVVCNIENSFLNGIGQQQQQSQRQQLGQQLATNNNKNMTCPCPFVSLAFSVRFLASQLSLHFPWPGQKAQHTPQMH